MAYYSIYTQDNDPYLRLDARAGMTLCTPGKTVPCGKVCRTPANCKKGKAGKERVKAIGKEALKEYAEVQKQKRASNLKERSRMKVSAPEPVSTTKPPVNGLRRNDLFKIYKAELDRAREDIRRAPEFKVLQQAYDRINKYNKETAYPGNERRFLDDPIDFLDNYYLQSEAGRSTKFGKTKIMGLPVSLAERAEKARAKLVKRLGIEDSSTNEWSIAEHYAKNAKSGN